MHRIDVADLLDRFVKGNIEQWEFDDFISVSCRDPSLEAYRREIARLPHLFPATDASHYTSKEGVGRILEIARILRASET